MWKFLFFTMLYSNELSDADQKELIQVFSRFFPVPSRLQFHCTRFVRSAPTKWRR